MDERNAPGKEQEVPEEGQKEEYSFLQEVIKDETGSGKKFGKDILRMAGFGFVFGIVACISFCAFRPWMEKKYESGPEQVTIPPDQENDEQQNPSEQQEEPVQEEPVQAEKPVLDTESYRQMLKALKEVAEESGKSVVEITGVTGEGDWAKDLSDSKYSVSGIILADNGQELLILGKPCPVENPVGIRVTFADNTRHEAVVKAEDYNLGLTVYAVPRSEIEGETWTQISTAVLGNSNFVNMGDTVIVLGKPFGHASSFTYGIVATDKARKEMPDGQYEVIYTDIAGSSAGSGVLVNIQGEIIGLIDQSILEEDSRNLIAGYGISDIKNVIELLLNGQRVPYTGLCGVDVTEEMETQGLPKGIYVKEIETDSPAMAAGIQAGDIITVADNTPVASVSGYHSVLMEKREGEELHLKGCRHGAGGDYVDIDFSVVVGSKSGL